MYHVSMYLTKILTPNPVNTVMIPVEIGSNYQMNILM